MRKAGLLILFTVSVSGSSVGHAHHSFAAVYDASQTVRVDGQIVSFSFRSPHSVVTIDAGGEEGGTKRWTVEWGAASALSNQGITREFFKPGDHVIVTGYPGRNPEAYIMVMRSLERPADGFAWGNRPGEVVD